MHALIRDLRQAFRAVIRNPSFSIVAVVTLVLGIGPAIAIFYLVNSILLRPLPYEAPEDLVRIFEVNAAIGQERNPSFQTLQALQEQCSSIESAASFAIEDVALIAEDATEKIRAMRVTPDFFSVLRSGALQGRLLDGRDHSQENFAALVSHQLWQRRFGGIPLVGKRLVIRKLGAMRQGQDNAEAHRQVEIVGILPRSFQFNRMPHSRSRYFDGTRPRKVETVDLWLPMDTSPERTKGKYWPIIARLDRGASLEEAKAEVDLAGTRASGAAQGFELKLIPLQESIVGAAAPRLMLIFSVAVAFVLAICCVNTITLFMSHLAGKEDEMMVLQALGAGRWRLTRFLLLRGLLISFPAGLIGMLAAEYGTRTLVAFGNPAIPRLAEVGLRFETLAFVILTSTFLGALCALVPALYFSSKNLGESLRQGAVVLTGRRRWLLQGFVIGQVALTLVLLCGGGLLVHSFLRLQAVDPGYQTENVMVFEVPFQYRLAQDQPGILFPFQVKVQSILEAIQSMPGIELAATGSVPLRGLLGSGVYAEGAEQMTGVLVNPVSEDFFRILGIPLLAGRTFTSQDSTEGHQVVILNESLSRQLWPNQDPVGKRLTFQPSGEGWLTVVGVVGDVRRRGLDIEPASEIYIPYLQSTSFADGQFLIRSDGDPLRLLSGLERTVRAVDRGLPVARAMPLEQLVHESTSDRRFNAWLLGVLSVISLAVATAGLYGIVEMFVSRRTRELGLRMALGAHPRQILTLCLGRGLLLIVTGLALGLAAALPVIRFLSPLLYEVSPLEPIVFLEVSGLLTITGLLACFIPACRALRIDPGAALKYE